jgi:hypothetical protein
MLRARWSASREPELTIVIKRLAFVVVLSLLANVSPLLAADSEPAGETIAGLHVAVDPSTGRLVPPTPEQRAKLAAALAQMIDQRTEGLEVRRLQNGMHLVDLQGRFRNVEVAVRGTDGEVLVRCIDAPDELEWLPDRGSEPSPAPRPATEER